VFFIVSPFAYGEQGFALHPPETFLEKKVSGLPKTFGTCFYLSFYKVR
jgi:hypothetical protein